LGIAGSSVSAIQKQLVAEGRLSKGKAGRKTGKVYGPRVAKVAAQEPAPEVEADPVKVKVEEVAEWTGADVIEPLVDAVAEVEPVEVVEATYEPFEAPI